MRVALFKVKRITIFWFFYPELPKTYSIHAACYKPNGIAYNVWCTNVRTSVAIVIGLEGAGLGEAHILGLLVAQLGQVRLEGGEVERGHELVHQLGHQIDVRLVATHRGVEQLNQRQGLCTNRCLVL